MISDQYPNFQAWIDVLAQRDAGFLFVTLLAISVAGVLANCWRYFPERLPIVRNVIIAAFYVWTLLAVLKGG